MTTEPFRPFDPARDFPGLVELISDVNAHDRSQDWFPTVESLRIEWAAREAFDPARDAIVVDRDGRLIAGGMVEWRQRAGNVIHSIQIWVLPDARRQGLGGAILAWLESHVRGAVAAGSSGPAELPHVLGGWVDGDDAASAAFAAATGYSPVRYGFQMRRPLEDPIPAVPMPDGLEVRPVLPEHIRPIYDADFEAFRDHFEPREYDEDDFARFTSDPDTDISLWQIAWDGDEVAGSVLNGIYPHENERIGVKLGWLDHVSVRRPWRGRGLAKALIARSLAVHKDRGMAVAVLGVDAANPTGALQLYEGFGFRPHRRWQTMRKSLEVASQR